MKKMKVSDFVKMTSLIDFFFFLCKAFYIKVFRLLTFSYLSFRSEDFSVLSFSFEINIKGCTNNISRILNAETIYRERIDSGYTSNIASF